MNMRHKNSFLENFRGMAMCGGRIKKLLLGAGLALVLTVPAYGSDATSGGIRPAISNYERDWGQLKELTPEILKRVNGYFESGELSKAVGEADLDWGKLIQMYAPGTALSTTAPDLEGFFEEAYYIWLLPVKVEQRTVVLNFNKVDVITDNARRFLNAEELERLEAKLGKWSLAGDSVWDLDLDYNRQIESVLAASRVPDGCRYFTVTALPGINMPMTIVMKDAALLYAFPTQEQFAPDFSEDYGIRTVGGSQPGLYNYQDVAAVSQKYLEEFRRISAEGSGEDTGGELRQMGPGEDTGMKLQ